MTQNAAMIKGGPDPPRPAGGLATPGVRRVSGRTDRAMLYTFPDHTHALAIADYRRPYADPIAARAGAVVRPLRDGTMTTDFIGWTWCVGADGRAGWVPDSWCDRDSAEWRLLRDFDARELSVRRGQRLRLLFSESGFVMAQTEAGERGWVPDAILALDTRGPAAAPG